MMGITSTEIPGMTVQSLTRITLNPEVMGGKPCIRGLRVTVGIPPFPSI